MALGKRKKASEVREVVAVPQTGNKSHPFTSLSSLMPSSTVDTRLYASLREAVPVIDAAISKLVRLLGEFRVVCDDSAAEKELTYFLENVNVGGTRQGINAFVGTFFEQLITMGTAVGEMVTDSFTITHLFNSSLESIYLCEGENPLDIVINSLLSGIRSLSFFPYIIPSRAKYTVHPCLRGFPS